MIIYLDIIMLFDFIINLIIMYSIEKLYTSHVFLIRLIISSLISSLFIPLAIYNYILKKIFKFFGGVIIYTLSPKTINIKEKIIKTISFYIINYSFVGILNTFSISKWYLLLLSLFILLILVAIESNKKYYLFIRSCKYEVIIKHNHKTLVIEGFLDTGNKSTYKGIPICYINQKYQKEFHNLIPKENIIVESVSGEKALIGYYVDRFLIRVNKCIRSKKVIICFVESNEDCLLNSLLVP